MIPNETWKSDTWYKTKGKSMRRLLVAFATVSLTGCLGMPDGVVPVKNFELNRYLGKWYEIARLDHSFERGLERVTAEYSMRQDGGVTVLNRGYSVEKKKWQEARGKAFFVNKANEGYLKVSFFGPFYGSYVVFELEKRDYNYAFVSGPDTSYLWLLARTPTLPQSVIDKFKQRSEELGFDTGKLIFVKQDSAADR